MAQWQRVGFQIRRLGVRIPLASSRLSFFASELACGGRCVPPGRGVQTPWRNGSASDSKSEGWGFESLWRHANLFFLFCPPLPARGPDRHADLTPVPVAQLDKASDYESEDWGFESLQG